MNKNPKVSVIMPVFNGEKYLEEAILSVLNQTFKDFELIVVNDGSTDHTLQVINQFKDKRIKVVNNIQNLGLAKAINKGLFTAKGKYIARCDGDDVNRKDRFEKQVSFLENNPGYVLVGSRVNLIDGFGKKVLETKIRNGYNLLPETDAQIRKCIFIRNPISHPSVVIKKKALEKVGFYRNFFNGGSEEYDLWFRLLRVGKAYNLPENLIKRRFHDTVFTKKHHLRVEFLALIVRLINLPSWFFSSNRLI